ncbi:MAG: DUF4347 domain-containing protein [Methylobacter sp.]
MLLGSSTVNSNNLDQYTNQLATLGNALSDDGDILLYGSNVAADQTGLQFINRIADLANADVAASNDITGSTWSNGNWVLEQTVGQIETGTLQLPDYSETLGSPGLATQIQSITTTDLDKYIEIGSLFSILSYGDGALGSGSFSGQHTLRNYNASFDEGFNDNYRSFFSENEQLGKKWSLLSDDAGNTNWKTSWDSAFTAWSADIKHHAAFTSGGLYNAYIHGTNSSTIDQFLPVDNVSLSNYLGYYMGYITHDPNNNATTGQPFPTTNTWLGDSNALLAQSFDSAGDGTLALTFRGTDTFDDALFGGQTWTGNGAYLHYEAFRPLINAAYEYAHNPDNKIKHIVVSGHSLGGAMADIFTLVDASRFAAIDLSDLTIVSIASPGLDPDTIFDTTADFGFGDRYDNSIATPSNTILDPNLQLDTQGISTFYHGFAHDRDRVYFAENPGLYNAGLLGVDDIGSLESGFTPNGVLRSNTNFGATVLNLPTINNSDATYKNPYGITMPSHGFGADHNGQIYWRDIHELYNSPLATFYNTQHVYFGRGQFAENQSDWFTPTSLDDAIGAGLADAHGLPWDLSGDDFILGLEGNDTLQGGGGNDLLDGGTGDDTLDGGIGNDKLSGGSGNDILIGGTGLDTYYAGAGDTIIDSDGLGTIIVGGDILTGGHQGLGETNFYSDDGKYAYQWSGGDLLINGTITVKNFTNDNDLGIHLIKNISLSPILTDLGVGLTSITGINNAGQIVGKAWFVDDVYGNGSFHAVLWQNGSILDLGRLALDPGDPPSASVYGNSGATSINNAGQIVGWSIPSWGIVIPHAFLWQDTMIDISRDTSNNSWVATYAHDINNAGQIVGTLSGRNPATGIDDGTSHGFLGQYNLSIPTGYNSSEAWAINDVGQVVGNVTAKEVFGTAGIVAKHAFLWQNETMIDLGVLPGGSVSIATDINNTGQIIGLANTASGITHSFLWQNGTMTDLGTLNGQPFVAQSINNAGQIVGYLIGSTYHAALWQDGTLIDLNSLLPTGSEWELRGGTGIEVHINDRGQITVAGFYNNRKRPLNHAIDF